LKPPVPEIGLAVEQESLPCRESAGAEREKRRPMWRRARGVLMLAT
jgi:hypothetical protein